MANLVAPVNLLPRHEDRMLEFKGLNLREFVEDGEMSGMKNLTSDRYPHLSPRTPRGTYALPDGVTRPLQIMARYNRIAMIARDNLGGINFYYDGEKVAAVTGLTESTRMVAINTKICFFPNCTYVELVQQGASVIVGAYGSLDVSLTLVNQAVTLSNTDVRMDIAKGHGLKYDDAINISGTITYTPSGGTQATMSCNVSCIVEQVIDGSGATDTIVLPRETFIELTGEGATNITLSGTATRSVPEMDHIVEWNNRLWGASSRENTIYACKLGDPTNWHYFQSTSLDSYYAQQGTDGVWTGVATYSGHIIFFKQNGMCRIYGTAPSNYQITNAKCFGVEEGSRLSVVTVNDTVYYKSVIGIMAYNGYTPVCISEKIGTDFKDVVGGSDGLKYYASVQRSGKGYELLVFDIARGIWHKEDSLRMRNTCNIDNRLYYIHYNGDELYPSQGLYPSEYLLPGAGDSTGGIGVINPENATESWENIEWSATFGPFDEYVEEHKIYSKLALRLRAKGQSSVKVSISEDEGEWEEVKNIMLAASGGDVIPILPRRCDRYSIKVEGQGRCEIASLTRRVRKGSFGKL